MGTGAAVLPHEAAWIENKVYSRILLAYQK